MPVDNDLVPAELLQSYCVLLMRKTYDRPLGLSVDCCEALLADPLLEQQLAEVAGQRVELPPSHVYGDWLVRDIQAPVISLLDLIDIQRRTEYLFVLQQKPQTEINIALADLYCNAILTGKAVEHGSSAGSAEVVDALEWVFKLASEAGAL